RSRGIVRRRAAQRPPASARHWRRCRRGAFARRRRRERSAPARTDVTRSCRLRARGRRTTDRSSTAPPRRGERGADRRTWIVAGAKSCPPCARSRLLAAPPHVALPFFGG